MANYKLHLTTWKGDASVDTIPDATTNTNFTRLDTNTGRYFYSNGTSWIEIKPPFTPVTTKTGAYTAIDTDYLILVDATTTAFTLTLPTAVGRQGKRYRIKKIDSTVNTITVDPAGTETIDGSISTWELRSAEEFIEIISDGANWSTIDYTPFDINSYKRRGTTENRWYIAGHIANTSLSNVAISANILYASPLVVARELSLNDLGINVITGSATTAAKLAIYKDNGNLQPSSLVYDAGEVLTDTNSVFASAAVSPSAKKLQPGLYWLAVVANGTPTIKFIPVASQYPILGTDNVSSTTYGGPSYYKGFTYPAGAMPDPFPTALTINAAAQIPAVYARFI